MKVTVIKNDESVIYDGKIFGHGESFEVDDLIGKSLIERGYVSAGNIEADDEAEIQEAEVESSELDKMSYADLKSLAAQRGLDAKGKKDELIARIIESEQEVDEVESTDELPVTDMPE